MSPEAKRGLKRGGLILLIGASLLALALGIGWMQTARQQQAATEASAPVPIGGAFTLTDENGQTVTDQTYRGKWLLVFFGFTHCPDVCPTALNDISLTLDQLGRRADKVYALFITVDPERDTVQLINEYTGSFHSNIIGLTGTPQQIATAAKAYRVYYKKVPTDSGYTMDHSAITYVIDPDGKYAAHFSHQSGPDRMAAKLGSLIP